MRRANRCNCLAFARMNDGSSSVLWRDVALLPELRGPACRGTERLPGGELGARLHWPVGHLTTLSDEEQMGALDLFFVNRPRRKAQQGSGGLPLNPRQVAPQVVGHDSGRRPAAADNYFARTLRVSRTPVVGVLRTNSPDGGRF